MKNINASRLLGLFLLILGLILTLLLYMEMHSKGGIHIILILAVPLFLAMGLGLIIFPPNNKKLIEIIGDKPLSEIFKNDNFGLIINFSNLPKWKQAILTIFIIGAIIANTLYFVLIIKIF